jgi:MFS family permease
VLAVLRRRDFGLLWLAGLVSVAGDWVLMTALPYVVYVRTGSILATAGLVVASLVPSMLLTSFAGVFVDRWDRRRLLVVTNLLQALTVVALLLVDAGSLWVVYVVAAAQSTVASFSQPAESALLPSLVPVEDLVPANALNVLNNQVGRLVGTPLGAVLLGLGGLPVVVVVDAATFLAAAALVAAMGGRDPRGQTASADDAATAATRFWREWLAGLRVVREDRGIGVLFVVFGLMTFGGTMLDPLFVPWVRDLLGEGVWAIALLTTTTSLAGIAGSVVVGSLGARLTPGALIGWGSLVAGLVLVIRFNLPLLWVAVALSAVGGITSVASSVGVETLAQARTPEQLRGRVFGSLQATIWLMSLLGAAVGGVIGEVVGLLPALDLASALVALSGVVVLAAAREPRPRPRSARTPGW